MNISEIITKRLDSLPFSRWHIGMIIGIGTIWIFDGYQVSLVSLFSKYILNEHSQTQYKSLANMYQIGCIVGSFIFGILAYYYGRRAVFMVTLLIYAIGVIFCVFGSIFPLFLLGRFLTGISVGGQFTAIFTAVDQFLPPRVRGRVNIIIDGSWHLGGIFASFLNLIVGEIQQWRNFFAIGFIGLIGLAFIRKSIPESPRWLIMRNRENEAQDIVNGIQNSVLTKNYFYVPSTVTTKISGTRTDRKFQQIPNQLDQNFKQKSDNQVDLGLIGQNQQGICSLAPNKNNSILGQIKLVILQYKLRFFISCFLIYSQAFFFNSVYYQYPILLKNLFNLSQSQISGYMLGLSICSFISTLLVGPFFDILGRRKMLLFTYGITGILLPFSNLIKNNSTSLQILTCFIFIFGSPASSSANLIASQIFPTSTRPIVLSLIFVVGMFGGMCGVWVDNYYVAGVLMVLAGLVGFFLCPKAQNKSLQQINRMSQLNQHNQHNIQ